eukprot:scaffold107916_cov20-Tisochrysis_lutea.AAC.2
MACHTWQNDWVERPIMRRTCCRPQIQGQGPGRAAHHVRVGSAGIHRSCGQGPGRAAHPESTSFDLTILQDPLPAMDHVGRAQAGLLILILDQAIGNIR